MADEFLSSSDLGNSAAESSITGESMASAKEKTVPVNQWVSSISNAADISRKSADNLRQLNSILGPLKSAKESYIKLDNDIVEALKGLSVAANASQDLNEIVFKVKQKVYIEFIDIYQKAHDESSIMKIEIKNVELDEGKYKQIIQFLIF